MSFISSANKEKSLPAIDSNLRESSLEEHSIYRIPQKAVILQMEDFYNLENKVANALLKAMPKCDATSIKIFELIVSAVNPKEPAANFMISIEKKLIYKFLNLNSNSKATDLRKKLVDFRNDLYFDFSTLSAEERLQVNQAIDKENESIQDERFKLVKIKENHIVSALEEIYWEVGSKYVNFKLTYKILFFLSNLGSDKLYTTYDLIGMNNFTSKYTVILYRWLRMKYQQFQFNEKNYKVKNKIEISVEDLRKLTDTEDLYSRFGNFENIVLKTPQEEINKNSVIKFEYRKIKKGRNIATIQFFIYDNPKNVPAKEERLTPRKSKAEREAEKEKILFETIRNPYTKILRNSNFLKLDYIEDDNLLIGLHDRLYPAYDKLVAEKGIKFLETHIKRVQNNQNLGIEVQSVPDYLKKALEAAEAEDFWREKNYAKELKKQGY